MSKDLAQLHPATADEVVVGDSVTIPDRDADLAKTFYKRQGRLLLEAGVPATICAGASSELGGGVFEDYIGVLPRYPLGVLQLVASNHWGRCKSTSPEEEQSCNDHSAQKQGDKTLEANL